jgi:hypothetical protein
MKKVFSWLFLSSFGLICMLILLPLYFTHAASSKTVVVTAADLDNTSSDPAVVAADGLNKWFMYNDTNDTIDNTLGSFVVGPGTPPHGRGSIQFTLGASPYDRKNIATYQFSGTPLASITQMSFSAYSHSGVAGSTESPYLNFNIDFSGSSSAFDGRLVYVPSANGPVSQDTWNTFDTINGGNALWTWSHYASHGNTWEDGNTSQYRTWNDILHTWPHARLLPVGGWLGIRVGEPGPANYTANVDSFTLGTAAGTTTFDFEPPVLTAQPVTATEGTAFNGTVATGYVTPGFTGPFSVTIDWGDGTTPSNGTGIVSGNTLTVNGSHTYAEEGSYPLTIKVTDVSGYSASASSTATVADASLTLTLISAHGAGAHLGILSQARFSDANTLSTAADFTATIAWGDKTTSTATVTRISAGNYVVGLATHTYASAGVYTITLTIQDDGGSQVNGSQPITVY